MSIRNATASQSVKNSTGSHQAGAVTIAKVTASGDPNQKLTVHGNVIRITGIARNSGKMQSEFALMIGGERVSVKLTRGLTPGGTAVKLKAKLPKGYDGNVKILVPAAKAGQHVEFGVIAPATLTVTRKAAK